MESFFEKLIIRIEHKRSSQSMFWKLLVFGKDSVHKFISLLPHNSEANWCRTEKGSCKYYPHQIACKLTDGTVIVVEDLLERLKPHCQVKNLIDVGCGEPDTISHLNGTFKPSKIFGFEPEPDNYEKVVKRYREDENIKIYRLAASCFDGVSYLHLHSEVSSGHSVKAFSLSNEKIKVKTIRLDTWAKENGVESFDVVKIDTQGNDFEVIKGIGEMLRTVKVLITEVWFEGYYADTHLFHEISAYLARYNLVLFSFSSLIFRNNAQLQQGDAIFVSKEILRKLNGA